MSTTTVKIRPFLKYDTFRCFFFEVNIDKSIDSLDELYLKCFAEFADSRV